MSTEAGCLTFNGSIENLYSLYLKLDMLKTITDELSESDAEKVNYVYNLLDTSFPFLRMIKMAQCQEDSSDSENDEEDDKEESDKEESDKEEAFSDKPEQTKEEMQAYYLAKLQAIMDEQEQIEAQQNEKSQTTSTAPTEKKALNEPKTKVPKEPKVKEPKEPKVKEPKVKMCQYKNCESVVATGKYKFCEQHTKSKK